MAERAGVVQVALVDEPFVDSQLGGVDPIGQRIRMVGRAGQPAGSGREAGPWLEIVGVVPDLGFSVGDPSRSGTVYWPILPTNVLWLGIRGDGDPLRWAPGLLETVREIDPDLLGFGLLRLAAIFPWRLGAGNPLLLAVVPAILGPPFCSRWPAR